MGIGGGLISFVGAGPGAADLLTLRAVDRLVQADVVVWASSLIPGGVIARCGPAVILHDSKSMTLEDVTAVFAAHPNARIVRLHSGDPTLYSAIAEQIAWCNENGRRFEIVPGVSSLAAAAAAAGCELTVPGVSQSLVITRLAQRTAASMSGQEGPARFAAHGPTMAIFLSAGDPEALQAELQAAESSYDADTPVVIAHQVSWPTEQIVPSTVGTERARRSCKCSATEGNISGSYIAR